MNRGESRAIVLAVVVGMLVPAAAQTPAAPQAPPANAAPQAPTANAPAPAPQTEPRPPVVALGDAAGGSDARHCLDLATNAEIIACAERYRSHKPRK
jgi:hypothetical protein